MSAFFALTCLLIVSSCGFGQLIPFQDEYEDGDAGDGNPVTWREPDGGSLPGVREVQNGDYILQGPEYFASFVDESAGPPFGPVGDVSVRTQLSVLDTEGGWVFSSLGIGGITGQLLWGGIFADGEMVLGEFISGGNVRHASSQLSFNPMDTDVSLQLDLQGNTLSLTGWPEGAPKPVQPQLVHVRATPPPLPGAFGVFINSGGGREPRVAFRSFEAVPVPEPATFILMGLGIPIILWSRGRFQQPIKRKQFFSFSRSVPSPFDQRDIVQLLQAATLCVDVTMIVGTRICEVVYRGSTHVDSAKTQGVVHDRWLWRRRHPR